MSEEGSFSASFFPRRSSLLVQLKPDSSLSAAEFRKPTLLRMAAWGLHPVSAVRQVPPFFDEYAISALSRNDEPMPLPPLSLIGNDQQLRDLLRGYSRIQSAAMVPTSTGLSRLLGDIITGMDTSLFSQLESLLPLDMDLKGIEGIVQEEAAFREPLPNPAPAPLPLPLITELRTLGYTGSLVEQDSVLIMNSPVNYGLFQSFLAGQEVWTEVGFRNLETQGLSEANPFMHDPLGNPVNQDTSLPVRSINALAVFAFMEWLEQRLDGVNIRLPHPHELSALPDSDASLWEYSAQYAQPHQSPTVTEPMLLIEESEMTALQNGLIAGRGRQTQYQILAASNIQVQNSVGETGMLTPAMVSPVTTFRLVFEGR